MRLDFSLIDISLAWCGALFFFGVLALPARAEDGRWSLQEVIQLAHENYPDLKAKGFELRAVEEDLSSAKWARYPRLVYAIEDVEGGANDAVATVRQPLFTFGKIRYRIEAASASVNLAEQDVKSVELGLSQEVARLFFAILGSERRSEIARQNTEAHLDLLQMIERRVKAEASAASDQTLAQARFDLARAELKQINQELEIARLQLIELTGRRIELVGYPLENSPEVPGQTEIYARAQIFSPALQKLEAEMKVAQARVGLVEAELLPDVQLTYQDRKGEESFFNPRLERLYIEVSLDTGHGLQKKANLNAAKERWLATRERIQGERLRLQSEAASISAQIRVALDQRSILEQLQTSTEAVVSSYLRQYTVGRKSWLDVMNAQREWTSSRYRYEQNLINLNALAIGVSLLTGQWFETIGQDSEPSKATEP